MSPKRRRILKLIQAGKHYDEICTALNISKQNLYTTIYQMKQCGVVLEKRTNPRGLAPKQMEVMKFYAENVPVPEIAQRMGVKVQTVWNHAAAAFNRLGLTVPGVDRIAALRVILGTEETMPKPVQSITMDDPLFN